MEDEQAQLIASFPGFIDTIQQTVQSAAQDFHVMVTTTDAGDSHCANLCAQVGNPAGAWCSGVSCVDWLAMAPSGCEATLGAGEISSAQGTPCGLPTTGRFFDSTQPDPAGTFACVAAQGVDGSGAEQPMAAMLEAVSGPMVASGACNQDFLRDDAILVVTFITDEEDDALVDPAGGSPGDPTSWAADLLAAKNGDPDAVVVIGLLGDTDLPGAVCSPPPVGGGLTGAEGAPRLRTFVDGFGSQGLWGSVCSADYAPLFTQAVSLIDTTCDGFIPPQ